MSELEKAKIKREMLIKNIITGKRIDIDKIK